MSRGRHHAEALATCISTVLVFCPACGSQSPDCISLLNNFANSVHASLLCDPTAVNPCGDNAPVVMYLVSGSTTTLESVAGNCTHSMATGKGPALNSLFDEYKSAGCAVGEECALLPGPAERLPGQIRRVFLCTLSPWDRFQPAPRITRESLTQTWLPAKLPGPSHS